MILLAHGELIVILGNLSNTLRGDGYINTDITIASYLYKIAAGEESAKQLSGIIGGCGSERLQLLWEIIFDTDIRQLQLLEERLFQFGGTLQAKDTMEREIFVLLISILHQIKLNS